METVASIVRMTSGAGLALCVAFYLLGVTGLATLPPKYGMFLFFGIFFIWLPTILFMNRLVSEVKQKDIWKAALRGCPGWMIKGLWALIAIVFVGFSCELCREGTQGRVHSRSCSFQARSMLSHSVSCTRCFM